MFWLFLQVALAKHHGTLQFATGRRRPPNVPPQTKRKLRYQLVQLCREFSNPRAVTLSLSGVWTLDLKSQPSRAQFRRVFVGFITPRHSTSSGSVRRWVFGWVESERTCFCPSLTEQWRQVVPDLPRGHPEERRGSPGTTLHPPLPQRGKTSQS